MSNPLLCVRDPEDKIQRDQHVQKRASEKQSPLNISGKNSIIHKKKEIVKGGEENNNLRK